MAGNRPLVFIYENARASVLPGAAKAELRLPIILGRADETRRDRKSVSSLQDISGASAQGKSERDNVSDPFPPSCKGKADERAKRKGKLADSAAAEGRYAPQYYGTAIP